MTALIATKAMRYGGRSLEPGDAFEAASARDARLLTAIRKAEPAPEEAAKAVPPEEIAAGAKKRAGTYGRRDMRAQK